MVGTLVEIRNQDLAIHGNGGATSLLKSVKKNSRIRVKNTVQSYADTVYKAKGVPVDTVSVMGTRFICLCCVRILPEESVGMCEAFSRLSVSAETERSHGNCYREQ
jgi:hypothetical protein